MTKPSNSTPNAIPSAKTAIAACTMALGDGKELQLFPAGVFRGRDGRPTNAPHWNINAALAQQLIAAASARQTPYFADYDHQTLRAKENGQPAPAAGWFKQLEWREGVGLFATDVDWTARAALMIDDKEYLYISPVFRYDLVTGDVLELYMAALTNNPAIDGMDAVLVAASAEIFDTPTVTPSPQETSMEELVKQLQWLLNLPVGATATDCVAQLQKLIDSLKQDPEATAAASFDLNTYLGSLRSGMAALSSQAPDPALYVPMAALQAVQGQVAALSAQVATSGANTAANLLDTAIKEGMASGKLLPAMEPWARQLGSKDMAALNTYLSAAPAIPALNGTQTNGVPPVPAQTGVAVLSAEARQLCAAFGVSETDYLATLKTETA